MEENQQQEEAVEAEPVVNTSTDSSDAEKNKGMAIIAYIIFFIPMLTDAKNSKFAMFHANQGLILLLTGIGVSIVGSVIPLIGWFLILPFGTLFVVVLWIIGMVNAAGGKMKELPLIGGIHILDK